MPNIAIVWDFDGTLIPGDSTSKTVEIVRGEDGVGKEFWALVKELTGKEYYDPKTGKKEKSKWEHLLGSDAPAWMYVLSRMAFFKRIPLNAEFFKNFVVPHIEPYKNVENFLYKIKSLEDSEEFQKLDLKIHHFIVSAGLKELVEQVFSEDLITYSFGCRYQVVVFGGENEPPESIPVFCMDETMKTRSLFEISKGSFCDEAKPVNKRVAANDRWAQFSDIIYVGDGPTDIPALSLTRYHGGIGIVVYNPEFNEKKLKERLGDMSLDRRADFITPADFSLRGELYKYIEA